ncbi:CaiB/BaiF CoA transferase family protein [Microbacterium sp. NPDC058389]|uniref:CaiB/BaiF CoA transferase family protein n=1 Tax=Microbacterium sp. NPDC058389 TaxID=3346475 RepID=UPI0036617320
MTLPLAGVRVVSLTHYLQGPACAQMLADLGADMVKVERPGGAYERHWSGAQSYVGDESVFYLLAGRNQRSVELNLREPEGADALWRLIEDADVVLENFRPGVLDKLGFSWDAMRARNPRLVFCSLTGFGPTGPSRLRPGQDLLIQSLSGLTGLSGGAASIPTPVGSAIVDQHAAALGAMGVLAALFRREHTGEGGRVDSNLLSAALDLQIEPFNYHLNGANLYPRSASGLGSRFHQAPYGVYETSDSYLTISLSDGQTLARAFNDPWLAGLSKEDQFTQREEISARIAEHLRQATTAEWEERLTQAGIWNAPVRDYADVEADPQLGANASIMSFDHPRAGQVRVLGHPVLYDGEPLPLRIIPPSAGEHTTEVLESLGYSADDLARMRADGAIGPDRELQPFDAKTEAPATAYSKSARTTA